MTAWFQKTNRSISLFITVLFICTGLIISFLHQYFKAYEEPYAQKSMHTLSSGWQYHMTNGRIIALKDLETGAHINVGEPFIISKELDLNIAQAAILLRANHQTANVYLDDAPLYRDKDYDPKQNPGMALHLILLPQDYRNKTLKIELTSPYKLYSGRTGPVLMGDMQSLQAYMLSKSMRSVVLMAMCLLIGFSTVALAFVQAIHGVRQPQNLALGVFAVVWALYYVCTEYVAFVFFSPIQMSVLSLSFYYAFQVPLTLFFYFSFERYRKQMLPAVILHTAFVVTAFALQLFQIANLPECININNVFLAGFLYTLVLAILEARNGNRMMLLSAPFMLLSYISMLYNFAVFYEIHSVVPYSYKDTYFLFILSVLIYNVKHFFQDYYRQRKDSEVLILQNRLAKESYERIRTHLDQVGSLKHEINKHFAAMQLYLRDNRYAEAKDYLAKYAAKTQVITETVYHEHFLVNAIVGNLLQAADKERIKVELSLNADFAHISDPDMYSLLNNILDNALEACIALPQESGRFIRLTMGKREPYFHITCVNSKSGNIVYEHGMIKTTKSIGEGHGYGLRTISGIVNLYDGILDIAHDETTFTITAALKDEPLT